MIASRSHEDKGNNFCGKKHNSLMRSLGQLGNSFLGGTEVNIPGVILVTDKIFSFKTESRVIKWELKKYIFQDN